MGVLTTDTWGISGPIFLLAYLVIASAVGVASTRARRALADSGADRPVGDLAAHPHDVALLNGGRELAVYSALSAMHVSRTIVTAGRGAVQAAGRLAPDADALERAVHFTAAAPVPRRRLAFHRPVVTALQVAESRLVGCGLLLAPAQRARIRAVGWWMAAVAGLGLVRLLAGVAAARPVGYLLIALLGVTLVAAVQLTTAPRRTRAGDALLAALKDEHHALAPEMKPDWTAYGPAGAALGVGVFGMGALWASDPAFAEELAAQKTVAAGGATAAWSGGGGGGDSDGGGGGCGGGCGG